MRPTLLLLILVLMSSFIVFLTTMLAGVRIMVIVGAVAATVLSVLWLTSRFGLVSRKAGMIFLILAFVALALTVLGSRNVLQKVVPYCGDGVCAANECTGNCPDCQPGMCDDGRCVPDWEICSTSKDCVCSPQSVCRPGEDADRYGCYTITCGDDVCDATEDRFNCCDDCGCLEDYSCRDGVCLFDSPKITFTTHIVSDNISATSLMANPMLLNASQHIHPLLLLRVRNEVANARNVSVVVRLGPYDERTYPIGEMLIGQVVPVQVYGPFDPDILRITNDTEVQLTIDISYSDAQEIVHSPEWEFPITILSRNTLDKYTHPSFFITPDDIPPGTTTVGGIWQQYRSIKVVPDTPGMQFPLETIMSGSGDPDDIAVLLVSALYKAGHSVSIVESDYGLFVRVWDDREYVILDPEKIIETYKNGRATQPGYAVWEFPGVWNHWNATVLSLEGVLDEE